MKKILIVISIIVALYMGAVYIFSDKKGGPAPQTPIAQTASYNNITSQELSNMLSQKDFFFVNVHIPYAGEIEKTDAFIPYDSIRENLTRFPKNKNAKIVFYCRSGMMSDVASQRLSEMGYTNVYNLTGGMIDWEKQGYTLIQNPR